MRIKVMAAVTALVVAASSVLVAAPANAQWRHHGSRGWGGGAALGGFAAGAIIGGALASRPYYYDDYAYGPGPGYGYGPGYVEGGDAVGYCMSRFRSYDPRSGTYLGNDGYRHSCP